MDTESPKGLQVVREVFTDRKLPFVDLHVHDTDSKYFPGEISVNAQPTGSFQGRYSGRANAGDYEQVELLADRYTRHLQVFAKTVPGVVVLPGWLHRPLSWYRATRAASSVPRHGLKKDLRKAMQETIAERDSAVSE